MKYFSMFSGIGGFELGIGKKGECIGYSEIDKYAIKIYKKHFPKHKNYGDATKIDPGRLPNFDMLCGGFPCQAFSIAGKRMGFEDTRGTLFFDIARIIKIKRPQIIFLENVKGLLSHDNGRTFATILATLDELGYNAEWQVLNSRHFGIPQNRERVFIIGHLRGTSSKQIFPLQSNNGKPNPQSQKGLELLYDGDYQSKRIYSVDGISPTIPTSKSGGNHVPFIATRWSRTGKSTKGGSGMLTSTKYSFALDRHPHYVNAIRRLTPLECERLQGFPDNWTEGVSETQRYTVCGNAVTTNVIKAITEELL